MKARIPQLGSAASNENILPDLNSILLTWRANSAKAEKYTKIAGKQAGRHQQQHQQR